MGRGLVIFQELGGQYGGYHLFCAGWGPICWESPNVQTAWRGLFDVPYTVCMAGQRRSSGADLRVSVGSMEVGEELPQTNMEPHVKAAPSWEIPYRRL